jgi:trans-2,3-dihydro-3-hydroxyanthranilate isomerase
MSEAQAGGELGFALVDVFATRPLGGNPLAIVIPDQGRADDLDDHVLRALAGEFNQSETTVLLPARAGGDRRLRSFTATGAEVVGAGHNALGAWWWLAAHGGLDLDEGTNRFVQELGGRNLPLAINVVDGHPTRISMQQAAPEFGPDVAATGPQAAALGVDPAAIGLPGHPSRVVSTGAAHLLVPMAPATLDALTSAPAALRDVLATVGAQGCYAYAPGPSPGIAAEARFFNPTVGIVEDPATGSAAGPLVAHLVDRGDVPAGQPAIVQQGRHVGRSSHLEVTCDGDGVTLAGSAVLVASGVLHL